MKFKFELLFVLYIQSAFAALSAQVTLGSVLINQQTFIKVTGTTTQAPVKGDCFEIALDSDIYSTSKTNFAGDAAKFYRPFDESNLELDSLSNLEGSLQIVGSSGYKAQLTLTADATNNEFVVQLAQFTTPYSQVSGNVFTVQYNPGCSGTGEIVTVGFKNEDGSQTKFISEADSSYGTPTVSISDNTVGLESSEVTFTVSTAKDFPQYGGSIHILIPTWYGDVADYVFQAGKVSCNANDITISSSQVLTRTTQWVLVISFSEYTGSTSSLEITCQNYRNPVFAQKTEPFLVSLYDGEIDERLIFSYLSFVLDTSAGMNPQTVLDSEISVDFYDVNKQSSSPESEISVQTKAKIEFQFVMPVPIEAGGCYLKVTFPPEFQLQEKQYRAEGYGIFDPNGDYSQLNPSTPVFLSQNQQLYQDNVAYEKGNYVIFQGCLNAARNGPVRVLFSEIFTPQAVRTTSNFKLEMFRTFDSGTYTLSQPILSATKFIPASKFISGVMTEGYIQPSLFYVQKATNYLISFTLKNALLGSSSVTKDQVSDAGTTQITTTQTSCIIVVFPANMEHASDSVDATVLSADNKLIAPKIERNQTYTDARNGIDCKVATLACYRITYQNTLDIPAGSQILVYITGPKNPISVQQAENLKIQTQLVESISDGTDTTTTAYQIDFGSFFAQSQTGQVFKTVQGGITPSAVTERIIKITDAALDKAYAKDVTYEIPFVTDDMVPEGGYIRVDMPISMTFSNTPNVYTIADDGQFFSGLRGWLAAKPANNQKAYVEAPALTVTPGGTDYTLYVSGLRNPRSTQETENFVITTFDSQGNIIGNGNVGNIKMKAAGVLSDLQIIPTNVSNGAFSDYTFELKASVPILDSDQIYFTFPNSMDLPSIPQCQTIEQIKCPQQVKCQTEKGKLVVTVGITDDQCQQEDALFALKVSNLKNSPTMLPGQIYARVQTQLFASVSEYQGNLYITNQKTGFLLNSNIFIEQSAAKASEYPGEEIGSKDFYAINEFNIRFTPTNAIPRNSWVVINYPKTLSLPKDIASFEENCQIQTSGAYSGAKYCTIDTSNRVIKLMNIYLEQEEYQQGTTVSFVLRNPKSNIRPDMTTWTDDKKWAYFREHTFRIRTVTFDLTNPALSGINDPFTLSETLNGKTFTELNQTGGFFVGIDDYPWNDIFPLLKCSSPCFTCLDNKPEFCTSCWGKDSNPDSSDPNSIFRDYFLQKTTNGQTCQSACSDGYTTNGKYSNFPQTTIDWTKTYYPCVECDIMCKTCQGQGILNQNGENEVGVENDKYKCLTCSDSFPFLIRETQKCVPQCLTGQYQKSLQKGQEECGLCREPCATCRKCTTADKYCDQTYWQKGKDPSAYFCTGCVQVGFQPKHIEDLESVEEFVENQRSMVQGQITPLSRNEINAINIKFEGTPPAMEDFLPMGIGNLDGAIGLQDPGPSIQPLSGGLTYSELYKSQWNKYKFPPRNLQYNKCIGRCDKGKAAVNGICLDCQAPCAECRNSINRCTACRQDLPQKYHYGTLCYERCPKGTQTDEVNKKCLGCGAGCEVCSRDDPKNHCLKCEPDLLLFNKTCLKTCPDGYIPNFFYTECISESQYPIVWFPITILTILMFAIAYGGQFSSKNVSKQHKVLLSFYAMMGPIDMLALIIQVLFTVLQSQGEYMMIAVPGFAIFVNYCINLCIYKPLWDQIDPPKPEHDEKLTESEVRLINDCDQWFDGWNEKYPGVADKVRCCTLFFSHKVFHLPFTHFLGYQQFTLKTQDYRVVWQWEPKQVKTLKFIAGNLARFKYKGMLVPRRDLKTSPHMKALQDDMFFDLWDDVDEDQLQERTVKLQAPEQEREEHEGGQLMHKFDQKKASNSQANMIHPLDSDYQLEGGSLDNSRSHLRSKNDLGHNQSINPFHFVQHPNLYPRNKGQMVPDNRVYQMFKKAVFYDCLFIRLIMIAGNIGILVMFLLSRSIEQIHIATIDCIIVSLILMVCQFYLVIKSNWEDQRLPVKMKDTKWNYLFINKRPPQEMIQIGGANDVMKGEWAKYLKGYAFNEMFLDQKLEELLNIFGRRQCKSCVEFDTGTKLEPDDREVNSWPVSPRDEAILGGDFDLVDFQLQNNVYADVNEPTAMFDSVARDFSEFGAQVFQFDVQDALARKGGNNLMTPGMDDYGDRSRAKNSKKKRGRKNKYYRQIDQEDDQEANAISDDDNIELDGVKEEDDEDEDEQEARRKQQEKVRLAAIKIKEEEEQRQKAEEAERQRRLAKERKHKEEIKKREEEDKILREQAEAKRRADEKKKLEEELLKQKDEELQNEIVDKHSPTKAKTPDEDDMSAMQVKENALDSFYKKQQDQILEAPPQIQSRKFNECDIIGQFDRDEKGNVITGEPDPNTGNLLDATGKLTNERGYLVDPKTGNIINNLNGEKMFEKKELDERGEVPAPYNFEKHNFNPHAVRGDFDFDRNGKPIVMSGKGNVSGSPSKSQGMQKSNQSPQKQFKDKKGIKVSQRGYRIDEGGHMVDNFGRKKFDRSQMTSDGDLPKLFNYNGRRFDITDLIGQLEKDGAGNIMLETNKNGVMVDKLGRPVNSKGYLIDEQGNVINNDGKLIFEKKHLKNEEIPKIFPFTKFATKNILGDFEMDPVGNPILQKDKQGNFLDRQGCKVNQKGYLVDEKGNVINKNGKLVFEKQLLDQDGDIPKVFRTGLLKSDTASSLSRLMDEIERNQPSDFDQEDADLDRGMGRPQAHSGETSVDSMMDDTPANYDGQNQRMGDEDMDDEDYGSEMDEGVGVAGFEAAGPDMAKVRRKKKKKRKKRRRKPDEYEDPSLREHLMAGAYGGIAKPKIKRHGVKYTTDLDSGLRDLAIPTNLTREGSNQRLNNQSLSNLVADHNMRRFLQGSGGSEVGSAIGSKLSKIGPQTTSKLLNPQQREAELHKQHMDEIKRKKIRQAKKLKQKGLLEGNKDADFTKLFGQDIDQFLENSEWDIESDQVSMKSGASRAASLRSSARSSRIKGLERNYLQRIDPKGSTGMGKKKKKGFRGSGQDQDISDGESQAFQRGRKQAWDKVSRGSSANKGGIGRR